MAFNDPSTMTLAQKLAGNYITASEYKALSGAQLEAKRNEIGIPTYHSSFMQSQQQSQQSSVPTMSAFSAAAAAAADGGSNIISYNPTAAAGAFAREQARMGEPGTAMNAFMNAEVAKGVPSTIALEKWARGKPTTDISGEKAAYYQQVNDLLKAGYSAQDASELAGTIQVTSPTESDITSAKKQIEYNSSVSAKNPYWNNTFAFSTTQADKEDAIMSQLKADAAALEGALERKNRNPDQAQANWQARFGNTEYAPTPGVTQHTTSSYTSNPKTTLTALQIAEEVRKTGGTVDKSLMNSDYGVSLGTEKSDRMLASAQKAISGFKSSGIPVDSKSSVSSITPVSAGLTTNPSVETVKGASDMGIKPSATESIFGSVTKNLMNANPASYRGYSRVGMSDYGVSNDGSSVKNLVTGTKQKIVDGRIVSESFFGAKHEMHKPKKQVKKPIKSVYGLGFIGMINELNSKPKPKLIKAPTTKKEKPVAETWGHYTLIDRKISNTHKSAIKLPSDKKPKKTSSEPASAWEQILFNKKKTEPKKTTSKPKSRRR